MNNLFDRRKRKKLEAHRRRSVAAIHGQQLSFSSMVQRAQRAGEPSDGAFSTGVLRHLEEFERRASEATDVDDLDDLVQDAEQQGQLRAYICPRREILDEGTLAIDLLEEWSVPKAVISKLRTSLGPKLRQADK